MTAPKYRASADVFRNGRRKAFDSKGFETIEEALADLVARLKKKGVTEARFNLSASLYDAASDSYVVLGASDFAHIVALEGSFANAMGVDQDHVTVTKVLS